MISDSDSREPHAAEDPAADRLYSPQERAWLGWAMFVLSSAAFVFLALRAGAPRPIVIGAVPVAAVTAWLAWRGLPSRPAQDATQGLERLMIAGAVVYFAIMLHAGDVLPAGDAIAVPQLAQTLAAGKLPTAVFPPGSSAHAYPPGYPILFAPVRALVPPVEALGVFKALNILVAALIPAAWAWLQIRLFRPPLPAWAVLAASYFAFLAVERTLGFVLSIGGKNAALLGLLLAPFAVVLATCFTRRWSGTVLAALALFGLTLVHYTMLHLMAALLGAYAVVGLASRRVTAGEVLRLALAGAAAALTMWLLLSQALSDPRAGATAFAWTAMLAGAWQALASLVAQAPPTVIFMDQDFGHPGSPYRGLLLIACTAISLAAAGRLRAPGLGQGALVWLCVFAVGLAFGYGALPAGITLDFARWFLWAVQAAIIANAACAILALLLARPARSNRVGYAAAGVVVLVAASLMIRDAAVETWRNRELAIRGQDLLEIEALLGEAPGARCHLIGESRNIVVGLAVLQQALAWNYAEIMSPCRYLNGSWVLPGAPGGQAWNGLPSVDVLRGLRPADGLIFVGRPPLQAAYSARLREAGLAGVWTPLGSAAGAHAWRFEPRGE